MIQLQTSLRQILQTSLLRFALVATAVLFPLFMSGCSESQAVAEHEHEHEHSHVHAKPVEFAETLKRVRREYRRVLAALSRKDLKHVQHELSHLTETIGALPEVAADSDLRKADWERVQAVSRSLLAECTRLGQMKSSPSLSERSTIDAALQQLDEIASKLSSPRIDSK